MLENLLEKYLKSGKDWLNEEYGTYKGRMTIMMIDDEDTSFTHQLIEAAKSHPEIQDSFYDTCFDNPCLGVVFKGFGENDYLLEEDGEDGAILYPSTHLSFDEFQEILSLLETNTPFPPNNGYYRIYWKEFHAELWLVHDMFNQIRIHVYKNEDHNYMEVYPEDVTRDQLSNLNEILTILKEAIVYFA